MITWVLQPVWVFVLLLLLFIVSWCLDILFFKLLCIMDIYSLSDEYDAISYAKDNRTFTQLPEQPSCHVFHWTCSGLWAQNGEKQRLLLWTGPAGVGKLTLSPSSTWQMISSVAGLKTGNFLPLTESCHSLLMKICGDTAKEDQKHLNMKYGDELRY